MNPPVPILTLGAPTSWRPDLAQTAFGSFSLLPCASLDALAEQCRQVAARLVLVWVSPEQGITPEQLLQWPLLAPTALECAVVVVSDEDWSVADFNKLLQLGVRDVWPLRSVSGGAAPASAPDLARRLALIIERKRLDDVARRAYAIDLATGLPNLQQLQDHMTHLLALREREPAAMALIVLRLEGLAALESSLGQEAANVLRRKVAVRLRASLRASDVVASLGGDQFGVLLAWIDSQENAYHVAQKLVDTVGQPYRVAGQLVPVGVQLGLALYPGHGKEAQALMSRALGQVGESNLGRAGWRAGQSAANDDEAEPAHS
jgi:diguanylate cyclase (GGDEF)-like protein